VNAHLHSIQARVDTSYLHLHHWSLTDLAMSICDGEE
jgi:hypothetical protein